MSFFGIQRVAGSVRKTAGGMIAAMRLIKAPHEMNVRHERAVTETGALTETDETHVMTDNTAAVMPRTCETPETARAGSQWNTETESGTGKGKERERGTGRGKGMMLIGKMMLHCRKSEVTEEDM